MRAITNRAGMYDYYGPGNRETFAYRTKYYGTKEELGQQAVQDETPNWGQQAQRSIYNVFANHVDKEMEGRDLLRSRLWHGVPQLSSEQMEMFEAAYTGHQFIFVIDMPKFMTNGIYKNKNLHFQAKNLKAVIERASTGFSGPSNITADFGDVNDGNGRKLSHVTAVTKEQNDITLRLHEFAGLPVKNALESWMTGTYDYKSEHGHYFGNLGIPGGWCLANHTASILVVQVDPSWQVIQDAAYYFNMFPTEVPFDHFEWTKGEHTIIDDYSITFRCNEERSPMIMYAAERYMNNRILSMVATSVYNSRQFVVDNFAPNGSPLDYGGFVTNITKKDDKTSTSIIDEHQYNIKITNDKSDSKVSAIEQYEGEDNMDKKPESGYEIYSNSKAALKIDRYGKNNPNVNPHYMNDNIDSNEDTNAWVNYGYGYDRYTTIPDTRITYRNVGETSTSETSGTDTTETTGSSE